MPTDITLNQYNQLIALIQNTNPGATVALDCNDTIQSSAIGAFFEMAGINSNNYPTLYSLYQNKSLSTNADGENISFVDGGANADGNAVAVAWYDSKALGSIKVSYLSVLNQTDTTPLQVASNIDTSVHSGFIESGTSNGTACPDNIYVVFFGATVYSTTDAVVVAGWVPYNDQADLLEAASTLDAQSGPTTNIEVNQPSHVNSPQGENFEIGLGRTDTNYPDLDYAYLGNGTFDQPPIVPFTGSASMFYPLSGATNKSPLPDTTFESKVYVHATETGTQSYEITTSDGDLTNNTVCTGANSFSWNFPWGNNQSASDTTSLVYQEASLTDQDTSYFYLKTGVMVEKAGTPQRQYVTVYSTGYSSITPSVSGKTIDNITFYVHCIDGNSQITLDDGHLAPISSLTNKHRVFTNQFGGTLGVEKTLQGSHKSSDRHKGGRSVFRLQTESGNTLTATGGHPVKTAEGFKKMQDLTVDDQIQILSPPYISKVMSCEAIDYEGVFYNLKLGDSSDRAVGRDEKMASYYANGILVGDHNALRDHARACRLNKEYMLSRLPKELHQDCLSAMRTMRR